jgi:hypothetical protein
MTNQEKARYVAALLNGMVLLGACGYYAVVVRPWVVDPPESEEHINARWAQVLDWGGVTHTGDGNAYKQATAAVPEKWKDLKVGERPPPEPAVTALAMWAINSGIGERCGDRRTRTISHLLSVA